jgi:hypothetical protein
MTVRALIAGAALLVFALVSPATAEVVQRNGVRVSFEASLAPKRLPRHGGAPVEVEVAAKISGTADSPPPLLRRLQITINRHGSFDRVGLPTCTLREIQPSTNAGALRACGAALVGEGTFSAQVGFTGQAPFPARGKILAFNGTEHGTPVILAHIYGTDPAPTSYTVPFTVKPGRASSGTVLVAELPNVAGASGYVTGISLSLGRTYTYRGERHGYLGASCAAPPGFPGALFSLARARLTFVGNTTLTPTVTQSCQVAEP